MLKLFGTLGVFGDFFDMKKPGPNTAVLFPSFQVVAGLLHYFILSTFCWMAIEALNLYRNFVKVFSGGASNFRFMVKSSIFSWGKDYSF